MKKLIMPENSRWLYDYCRKRAEAKGAKGTLDPKAPPRFLTDYLTLSQASGGGHIIPTQYYLSGFSDYATALPMAMTD